MNLRTRLRVSLVGLLMGAAELVPGVSGGTIAFVSGFYRRLVDGVRRFTPAQVLKVIRQGPVAMWRHFDMTFLVTLFGSMGVAILLLARGVGYLLEEQPVFIWSFFFGLVLTSVWAIGRGLSWRGFVPISMVVYGAFLGFALTRILPVEVAASPAALILGASVAVCAWILPGISGSFVLLLLGLYTPVILAIRDLDVMTLLYVAVGCGIGLSLFSQFLGLLLARFQNLTMTFLTGVMVGSLPRIWPWRDTVSYQIKSDGTEVAVVQSPVLPQDYAALTGGEPNLVAALVGMVLGVALIIALQRLSLLAASDGEREARDEP